MKTISIAAGVLVTALSLSAFSSCSGGKPANTKSFTLTWEGHAGVKLKTKAGKVIYIDPAESDGDFTEPADYVLVTHSHEDHKPSSKVAYKDVCVTITWKEAIQDNQYKTFNYDGITIEAVPAGGNRNHKAGSCAGYIVSFDGVSVYHAGDTSYIDEMQVLSAKNITFAMFPIDGVYNMNAEEATKVADTVGAKFSIPIHMDNAMNQHKENKFTPAKGRLILEPHQTISLKDGK